MSRRGVAIRALAGREVWMARPPIEEPEGLVYRPELLPREEEAGYLELLAELRFDPIVLHGQAAKRTAGHYGLAHNYETRTPQEGEPLPAWLLPLRRRAAELAGHAPEELVEALV